MPVVLVLASVSGSILAAEDVKLLLPALRWLETLRSRCSLKTEALHWSVDDGRRGVWKWVSWELSLLRAMERATGPEAAPVGLLKAALRSAGVNAEAWRGSAKMLAINGSVRVI